MCFCSKDDTNVWKILEKFKLKKKSFQEDYESLRQIGWMVLKIRDWFSRNDAH